MLVLISVNFRFPCAICDWNYLLLYFTSNYHCPHSLTFCPMLAATVNNPRHPSVRMGLDLPGILEVKNLHTLTNGWKKAAAHRFDLRGHMSSCLSHIKSFAATSRANYHRKRKAR